MSPSDPNATLAQALRLLHAGDVAGAEWICRRLAAADRGNHRAAAILGQVATMRGRHAEAVKMLKRCVSAAPSEIDYQVLLAEALATQGRHREALSRYDRALKLDAAYPPALAGKANVLTRTGDTAGARAVLEPFVDAGTEDAGMAIVYARIARRRKDHDRAVAVIRRHLDDEVAPEIKRTLWFELGGVHESAAEYDRAFEAFTEGNRLSPGRWDPIAASARYDRIMEVFSVDTLRALPRPASPSELPVLIVGIPRCGSTLVEQIIDAHPDAHGAGEILLLPDLAGGMAAAIGSTLPYPDCVRDLARPDVEGLARSYLDGLRALAPRAKRICDKHLINYEHLGLVAVLLPRARVIHCRRDPRDTCLSCYQHKFAPGTPAYTRDLRHLGMLYNDYLALMEHWRRVLDLELLEVDYERLVADQETETRRIIEFLGLGWSERCLRFWESRRQVLTLSRDQVTRPIYQGAVGRHARYARHLGPLEDVLTRGLRGSSARA